MKLRALFINTSNSELRAQTPTLNTKQTKKKKEKSNRYPRELNHIVTPQKRIHLLTSHLVFYLLQLIRYHVAASAYLSPFSY